MTTKHTRKQPEAKTVSTPPDAILPQHALHALPNMKLAMQAWPPGARRAWGRMTPERQIAIGWLHSMGAPANAKVMAKLARALGRRSGPLPDTLLAARSVLEVTRAPCAVGGFGGSGDGGRPKVSKLSNLGRWRAWFGTVPVPQNNAGFTPLWNAAITMDKATIRRLPGPVAHAAKEAFMFTRDTTPTQRRRGVPSVVPMPGRHAAWREALWLMTRLCGGARYVINVGNWPDGTHVDEAAWLARAIGDALARVRKALDRADGVADARMKPDDLPEEWQDLDLADPAWPWQFIERLAQAARAEELRAVAG